MMAPATCAWKKSSTLTSVLLSLFLVFLWRNLMKYSCLGKMWLSLMIALAVLSLSDDRGFCRSTCWVKELAPRFPRVTGVPLRALLTHERERESGLRNMRQICNAGSWRGQFVHAPLNHSCGPSGAGLALSALPAWARLSRAVIDRPRKG